MNPTPGGYAADDPRSARYSAEQIRKYLARLSGPLLDRIDLHVEVPTLAKEVLMSHQQPEDSASVRTRVINAWQVQLARQGCSNAELSGKALAIHCQLAAAEQALLTQAIDRLGLSARAYHRVLRVARTIADLQQLPNIGRAEVIAALNCRQLEKLLRRA